MQIHIGPALANHSSERVAGLIWSTDPVLMKFMFGDISVFQAAAEREWPSEAGLLCHKQAVVAEVDNEVVGLCVGHTAAEYGPNFEAAQRIQSAALGAAEGKHLRSALNWMDRLFPEPRDGSFYVLELAVSEEVRGQGLGCRLFSEAIERAERRGCARLALDVAADNPAVDFYRRVGLEVEIETRVPFLADGFGIGTHLHMSAPLEMLEVPA